MTAIKKTAGIPLLLGALALPMSLSAQEVEATDSNIDVYGSALTEGPEVEGIITSRSGDKIRVTLENGTTTDINCMMMDAEMYGMIPKAKIEKRESAPPENMLNKPRIPP